MSFYQSLLESTKEDGEAYKGSDRKLMRRMAARADAASKLMYGGEDGEKAAKAKGAFNMAPKGKVKRKGIPHSVPGQGAAVASPSESAYDDIKYADQLIDEYC